MIEQQLSTVLKTDRTDQTTVFQQWLTVLAASTSKDQKTKKIAC
jgi:hypothetical protein